MLRKFSARWWRTAMCLLLCLIPVGTALAQNWQGNAPDEAWANPSVMAMKGTGQVSASAQTEDLHHINYDCLPETFRYDFEPFGSMHTGCFASTAFGGFDIDNYVAYGFGLSGAVSVKTFGNQAILPIPDSAGLFTTSPASPMGSYLHYYAYLPSDVQLQYDWQLKPYLQLPLSANKLLSDTSGQPIIVNPQTVAYSDNGSWMVVESPWRSFFRVNMATFDIVPFAPSFTTEAFDYANHESQLAITDDGRYVTVQSNEFKTFKVYDLATCIGTVTTKLEPLSCRSHDYQPYVNGQITNLGRIQRVRFVNDGLISFHAQEGADNNAYELSPTDKITNLLDYLALGDSYSSGEGAFDYVAGSDTANNLCHQSANSYPYLLAKDIFTVSGGHSVACSGAVIDDISDKTGGYAGQAKDRLPRNKRTNVDDIMASFTPGYIAQHEFVQKYQPRVMTVGIGGNDIGFADIIKACVMPRAGNNTCYSSYEDRKELAGTIDHTYDKWVAMYRQLQSEGPNTTIYAIGYPEVAVPNGNCGVNVHLNGDEIIFSNELIDYLNSVIQKAATDSGVIYVDISHALDGHRLCEASNASVAVNGLTAGKDKFHVLGDESYHPNALGQELIEQAILKQTHNFTTSTTSASTAASDPTIDSTNPLLAMPRSGRTVRTTIPTIITGNDVVQRSETISININGLQGPQPNNTYTITLHDSNTLIGTINSDGAGNITGAISIPAAAPPGAETLDVAGPDLIGQTDDFIQSVYISPNTDDSDEDGVPNSADSCPLIPNSSQDTDRDSIDDVCDGLIGSAPPADTTSGDLGSSSSFRPINTSPPSSNPTVSTSTVTSEVSTTAIPVASAYAQSGHKTTAVLGISTSRAPDSAEAKAPLVLRQVRDNIPTIFWMPWAIDAGLALLLLMLLAILSDKKQGSGFKH